MDRQAEAVRGAEEFALCFVEREDDASFLVFEPNHEVARDRGEHRECKDACAVNTVKSDDRSAFKLHGRDFPRLGVRRKCSLSAQSKLRFFVDKVSPTTAKSGEFQPS